MSASSPKITAYLKTYCGWSHEIRTVLGRYALEFTEKDILKNPAFRWEMEQKSGQSISPCVIIDGAVLSGIGGEDLEGYLVGKGIVEKGIVRNASEQAAITSDISHEDHSYPLVEG